MQIEIFFSMIGERRQQHPKADLGPDLCTPLLQVGGALDFGGLKKGVTWQALITFLYVRAFLLISHPLFASILVLSALFLSVLAALFSSSALPALLAL